MDFGATVNSVGEQFRVIWNAPIPFIVVIAIVALAMWRAMEWRYAGIIEKLKEERPKSAAPAKVRVGSVEVSATTDAEPLRAKALASLKSARDNAVVALHQGSQDSHRRAYHEAEAAMFSIKQQFGIGPMKIPKIVGDPPYRVLVEAYLSYIDRFYPLLREGHVDEARERAKVFNWSWGSGPV